MRGRAEIETGLPLDAIRTYEQRGALLATPQARADNDRMLFDLLLQNPPALPAAGAGISERERGWLELPGVLAAAGSRSRGGRRGRRAAPAGLDSTASGPSRHCVPAAGHGDGRRRGRAPRRTGADAARGAAAALRQAPVCRRGRAGRTERGLVRLGTGSCAASHRNVRHGRRRRRRVSARSRRWCAGRGGAIAQGRGRRTGQRDAGRAAAADARTQRRVCTGRPAAPVPVPVRARPGAGSARGGAAHRAGRARARYRLVSGHAVGPARARRLRRRSAAGGTGDTDRCTVLPRGREGLFGAVASRPRQVRRRRRPQRGSQPASPGP